MELASRIFDVVTREGGVHRTVRDQLPELTDRSKRRYWRRVLRMAALCHDLGHLPFSHAAEKQLLPDGWDHERLTADILRSPELADIWAGMEPRLNPEDIIKLALGPGKAKRADGRDIDLTPGEEILAEIIVGDAFGADRMDYLLRDSYHAGVAYGRFDHFRLVDTLRVLPRPTLGERDVPGEPALGVEEGGLHSAEALLLARYMMYTQVYCHHVRRIYDIHLCDFLCDWLRNGRFATDVKGHLAMTDCEVLAAINAAAATPSAVGHDPARRIRGHDHFRRVYSRNPEHVRRNPDAGTSVFRAVRERFGDPIVRHDSYAETEVELDFPVLEDSGVVDSARSLSDVLQHIPVAAVDNVFVAREQCREAEQWVDAEIGTLVEPREEAGDGAA
jgi:hypothetical protein